MTRVQNKTNFEKKFKKFKKIQKKTKNWHVTLNLTSFG